MFIPIQCSFSSSPKGLQNQSTPVANLTAIPPEFLLPLLNARDNLTLASDALIRMAESLDSQTRTGDFLNDVLTMVEWCLDEEYGVN